LPQFPESGHDKFWNRCPDKSYWSVDTNLDGGPEAEYHHFPPPGFYAQGDFAESAVIWLVLKW